MLCPGALQQKEAAVAAGSAPSSPEQVHTHGEELKCTSTECWQIHAMPGMLHPAALSLLPHFLTDSPTRLYWSKCGWAAGLGCSNRGMWWGRDKLVSSRARHREERPGLTAQQRGGGRLQEGQGRVLKYDLDLEQHRLETIYQNRAFPWAKRITPILKISYYFSLSFFHSHCD